MNFRNIWNNRIFRTFLETFFGTIVAYFADHTLEIDSKKIICLIIIGVSTASSKVLPLLEEKRKTKEEVTK